MITETSWLSAGLLEKQENGQKALKELLMNMPKISQSQNVSIPLHLLEKILMHDGMQLIRNYEK